MSISLDKTRDEVFWLLFGDQEFRPNVFQWLSQLLQSLK